MRKDTKAQWRAIAEWVMDGEFKFGVDLPLMFHMIQAAAQTDKGMYNNHVRETLKTTTQEEWTEALVGYKRAKELRKKQGMG